MGCCVSKCRSNYNKPSHLVEHKLHPISQAPPLPTKISPSPPSPTSSNSSFTLTTSNTISSASSSSKDSSFSNDFLLSCYKHNPHITRINSLTHYASLSFTPPTPKLQPQHNINPSPIKLATLKQSPPQSFSMPHKRVRSDSPTNLTRHKSFRKDTRDRSITINYASHMQSRTLIRSPSPNRTFNADKCWIGSANSATNNVLSKRIMNSSKVSVGAVHSHSHSALSSTRKERVKAVTPNNRSPRVLHSSAPKVDETVVIKDVLSDHDMDLTQTDDIDNPLISLDCFIFL